MIVLYSIDWTSLYKHWFVKYSDCGLNPPAVNEFQRRLRGVRKRIKRNGVLFCDKLNASRRGLSTMLSELNKLQQEWQAGENEGDYSRAWNDLSNELKQYLLYYEDPEYRILVDVQENGVGEFAAIQQSFDEYIKSTRLNRKRYGYPAVAITELVGGNADSGFSWVTLRDFDECPENEKGEKWACCSHVVADDREESDSLFAALSVASGTGEKTVKILDPYWSKGILANNPDSAWKKSAEYWLKFFADNPNVETIVLLSADEISQDRKYTFDTFVKILESCCLNARAEDLKVHVGLRDDTWMDRGRKVFHNRYLVSGRFLIGVPNGLDIVDGKNRIRDFDIYVTYHSNNVVDQILDAKGKYVIRAKDVERLVDDHRDCLRNGIGSELAEFRLVGGRLSDPANDGVNDVR